MSRCHANYIQRKIDLIDIRFTIQALFSIVYFGDQHLYSEKRLRKEVNSSQFEDGLFQTAFKQGKVHLFSEMT